MYSMDGGYESDDERINFNALQERLESLEDQVRNIGRNFEDLKLKIQPIILAEMVVLEAKLTLKLQPILDMMADPNLALSERVKSFKLE